MHLDLYARDRELEVERLLSLGALRHPLRYRPDADFVVLADPDGNLFCLVKKQHRACTGARFTQIARSSTHQRDARSRGAHGDIRSVAPRVAPTRALVPAGDPH